MSEQYANSAYSTLASGISAGATSLAVTTGHGARFPATGDFRLKIDNEILLATARSSDTITVTRGAESTVAASHSPGATVALVLTRGSLLALFGDTTLTGQSRFAAGSESAPSITVTGDLDTGINFPSADAMMLTAGGDDAAKVNAVGMWIQPGKRFSVGDAEAPSGNLMAVSQTISATSGQMVTLEQNNIGGSGGDVSGLRVVIREMTAADNQAHGAEIHGLFTSGTGAIERSAATFSAQTEVASDNGARNFIIRIISVPAAWGMSSPEAIDDAIVIQPGDGVISHHFRSWNHLGDLCHDLDDAGHALHDGNIYSTGNGADAVGILPYASAPTGQTWGGMSYNGTTNRLEIGATTAGTSVRDVHIGPSGGKLIIGPDGYGVFRAVLDAASNANLTLTTSYADISNASVSLDRKGNWRVTCTWVFAVAGSGDNGAIMRGILATTGGASSTALGSVSAIGTSTDGNWITMTREYTVTVTTTSVTAKLQAKKDSGSGTSAAYAGLCTISAEWVGQP